MPSRDIPFFPALTGDVTWDKFLLGDPNSRDQKYINKVIYWVSYDLYLYKIIKLEYADKLFD